MNERILRDRGRGRRRRRRDRALACLLLLAAGLTALALTQRLTPAPAAATAGVDRHHQMALPGSVPAAAAATAAARDMAPLNAALTALIAASAGEAGIYLQELGGPHPSKLELNSTQQFTAASTYKLPLLMAQAERRPDDRLCFQADDWEDGPFGDYVEGACYRRADLMERTGKQSDNTSARILLRDLGGQTVLDAYARGRGARNSQLVDPNLTTAADLGRLMVRTPRSLYRILTDTENQSGLPAGVPGGVPVAHKDGWYEDAEADVGVVLIAPRGPYVLAVCTQGIGGEAGWQLIAAISRAVWAFESAP